MLPSKPALLCSVAHGRDILCDYKAASSREYLITNGIGGYGSASLAGTLTRSYHGLLIAALKRPLDRTLLLSALEEAFSYLGNTYTVGTGFYRSVAGRSSKASSDSHNASSDVSSEFARPSTGRTSPPELLCRPPVLENQGVALLESFRLEGTTPVFTYAIADALLEKRIFMKHGYNAVCVRYKLVRASQPLGLVLHALVNHRNHHGRTNATSPGFSHSTSRVSERTVLIEFCSTSNLRHGNASTKLVLHASRGDVDVADQWVCGKALERERERCLPDVDHHLHAASFCVELLPGSSLTVTACTVDDDIVSSDGVSLGLPMCLQHFDGEAELESRRQRESELIRLFDNARADHLQRRMYMENRDQIILGATGKTTLPCSREYGRGFDSVRLIRSDVEPSIAQLVLAADQFIIDRGSGKSILAGYHWFADWSRDAMIAVTGLALCTGRTSVAREILLTFADYVSQGMLPNRFPDDGTEPRDEEYNTADGTLWYFESLQAYFTASQDIETIEKLFPVLVDIIEAHISGTRFGICVDPEDGLLKAGTEGVAVTWMDAQVGNEVMTPRIGKPVELSALWFNSLSIMSTFSKALGDDSRREYFSKLAYKTELSFRERFWNAKKGYCYDVVDGPNGESDSRLRPNQLLSCSLQWSPLSHEQRLQVVETCMQELLTSYGLRSLSQNHEGYIGVYDGDIYKRDKAYHNGTVWAWLLGPFVTAHVRAYQSRKAARSLLLPLLNTLGCDGQGTLSEIFDGDAPFKPRGCIAQAWSVSEFLRAWLETEPDGT